MIHAREQVPTDSQETEVIGKFVLGPCLRPGTERDWWKEQHTYCTGSHHLGAYSLVICSCDCHKPGRFVMDAPLVDLPADLQALLMDPTVVLPGDREAFLQAAQWGRDKVRELEAEVKRKHAALGKYGRHLKGCEFSTTGKCGCGFMSAIDRGTVADNA